MDAQATKLDDEDRSAGLIAWQWTGYPNYHAARRTLLIHLFTNPIFLLGNLLILAAPLLHWPLAPVGLLLSAAAFAAQGYAHRKLEARASAPFRSRGEMLQRVFAEQWINWPRYVLGGGFAKAWRAASWHRAVTPP